MACKFDHGCVNCNRAAETPGEVCLSDAQRLSLAIAIPSNVGLDVRSD
jgi:hypothetical protein